MVVENVSNKIREDGNGSKVAFTFPFKVYKTSDINVFKVVKATQVATAMTLDVDYTVVLNTATDGGTVTYVVAPTALQESFIISDFDVEQQTDIPARGALREPQIENALDRAILLIRQMAEQLSRALKFSATSLNSGIEMPEPEASKIPGWNAAADGMENYDNPAVAQAAAEVAQTAAELAETNAETARDLAIAAKVAAEAAAALAGAGVATGTIVGGALSLNAATASAFNVTANDNFTLNIPTNGCAGQRVSVRVTQDGSGNHALTLHANFLIASELVTDGVVLSTAAASVDKIGLYCVDGTVWEVEAFGTDYAVAA
jgi:Flp pilus assembly protein TadG